MILVFGHTLSWLCLAVEITKKDKNMVQNQNNVHMISVFKYG